MARTGSGKTAAFVIPMIERLKAHSAKVGARAIIMSPSRELALQTLKVVKEFGKGTNLKCVLLVGGDSLEEQFGFMTTNPDIIIATPGRFLHLKVEMNLSLSSIQYAVFDEADRLFEMGFAEQLTEILHALPTSRQTLLFSATLPKSLVEFARAGLQDPELVRLDAETKVSPDLQSAFFSVKTGEKEAALLHILHDVIQVPVGVPEAAQQQAKLSGKRKRGHETPAQVDKPTEHSTIVFAATKHHVEYLGALLREQGFAVSYVYGSLDQTARKIQVDSFRKGRTNIMVVTDVAARGIDIPILANVINYDFPPQPKIFVHRVGRTARAGQKGWSYSILQSTDAPYLLDLQLFLDRKMVLGREGGDTPAYATDMIVGGLDRNELAMQMEWLNKLLKEKEDVNALRSVAAKAEKLYIRTRSSASSQSATRAKEIVITPGWGQLHPVFGQIDDAAEDARNHMLARISNWTPKETIFEINMGKKVVSKAGAEVMREMRKKITPRNRLPKEPVVEETREVPMADAPAVGDDSDEEASSDAEDGRSAFDDEASDDDSESELEVTISKHTDTKPTPNSSSSKPASAAPWKDSEFFMSYTPRTTNLNEDKGYSITGGAGSSSFVTATRDATMDLTNDDSAKSFGAPARAGGGMRWDKKANKYVNKANDADGSRGAKSRMIRGESGVKIAASFQSGRFDRWRHAHRLGKMPQVGEVERPDMARATARNPSGGDGAWKHFKHKLEKAPKDADKFRDDYHVRKKRVAEAKEKRVGKYKDGEGSRREVKGKDDIRRNRKIQEQKRLKNARPSKGGKK